MIKDQTGLRRISILFFIAMLVMFVVHVQILVMFNRQEVNIHGNDTSGSASMVIDPRAASTSKWLKRDFPLSEGRTVDLTGQTIDETICNNSGDLIKTWQLRINIAGDCFINQAWTGTLEIHQFVGTDREAVQTLDLQNYVLDDVKLQYRYDGDLLIPLQKGDYLLYFPSEHYTEMPVEGGESVTIGMIFYYLDELDLSDYDLNVHFYRTFSQGWSFIAFVVLAVLWVLSAVVYATSVFAYRNAQKQMELRRSGLSDMSELYEAIYIINLSSGEMTPVSPGEYIENLRQKYSDAKELLHVAVLNDADGSSLEAALAFVDTDTLADRLKDRESAVFEFVSKLHGWCRFRFFAMDRAEGKPLENVIFAVQDINDEKTAVKDLSDRLEKLESTAAAGNAFLSDASRDLRAPVTDLLALDEQILRETDPEKIRTCAEGIRGTASRMLTLIGGLSDRAAAQAGILTAASEPYSLKRLVADAFEAVRPLAKKKGVQLLQELSDALPDALLGDAPRLKEVIVSLLSNAINHSADGAVRLSVFGKKQEEAVHLLFSVRSVPENEIPAGPVSGLGSRGANPDLDLEVAGSLLASLNSELKSVRSPDAWMDVYFEIDQRIAAEDMKQ